MSTSNLLRISAIVAVTTLLSGCRKAIDFIRDHPTEEYKICRIEKLKITAFDKTNTNIAISYNNAGDPISMTSGWDVPAQQSGYNYHFRYDKKGRLSDNLESIQSAQNGESQPFLWHRYAYPSKNIIIDSIFGFEPLDGNAANPPIDLFNYYRRFTLDNQGRIIGYLQPAFSEEYQYDARGNLIIEGVTYDNNINPSRTNKVWMFLNNDYSINCPKTGQFSNFNAFGLPQTDSISYLFGYSGNQTIFYNCACNTKDL